MNRNASYITARHTHTLLCQCGENNKPQELNIGNGYTWNNGYVTVKATSNIKNGEIIILKPLQE